MRKEVFYSLLAMTAAPMAANAAVGNILPDAISFDGNAADLDKTDATAGTIQWVKGEVTFTVAQKLQPGSYTFRAYLKNPAAAVRFKIEKAKTINLEGNLPEDKNYIDISKGKAGVQGVEFTIDEAVTGLVITLKGAEDYTEGSGNDFFIGVDPTDDTFVPGLSFDTDNFAGPLTELNNLIDNYVNQVFPFESAKAKQVMNTFKEKIQALIVHPENLTYKDFEDMGLFEDDLTKSPIFKDATGIFNLAVRLEAEYQANKIKKDVEDWEALFADADGNVDPRIAEMAQKVLDEIDDYKDEATEKTGATLDDKGNYAVLADGKTPVGGNKDAAVVLDPADFDVDPAYAPLTDIAADKTALVNNAKKVNELAKALKVSYDNIDATEAALDEMFGPYDEKENPNTMAQTHPDKAGKYLDAAKALTNFYRDQLNILKGQIMAKDIKDMDDDFCTEMKAKLDAADNEATMGTLHAELQKFFTLYKNYQDELVKAEGGGLTPLTNTAEKRFNDQKNNPTFYDANYSNYKAEVEKLIHDAQTTGMKLPDDPKNPTADIVLKDKDGKDVKTKGYKVLASVAASASSADINEVKAFNAFVEGLNLLDGAYIDFEAAEAAVDAAYEANPNKDGYDSREYFKEKFSNIYYEEKTDGSLAKKTFTTDPTKAFNATSNAYYYDAFLKLLNNQLDAQWTFKDGKYNGKMVEYATTAGDFLLKTVADFQDLLAVATNGYADRGVSNAALYAQFSTNFAAYKEAVEKLRKKVVGTPVYAANQSAYMMDGTTPETTLLDENGADFLGAGTYDYGTTDANYKQILASYDKSIKTLSDMLAEAKKLFDNAQPTTDHVAALAGVNGHLKNFMGAAFDYVGVNNPALGFINDDILANIDWFVADGGIIDQEIARFAQIAPMENYASFVDHLNTTDGALSKLLARLTADKGTAAVGDGWEDGDYKVGYDQNEDGEIQAADDELVDILDMQKLLTYDGKALTAEKVEWIKQTYISLAGKYNEALAIFEDWTTNADAQFGGKGKASWTKEDYEVACTELGNANAIINEVNSKLETDVEKPLILEVQLQRELQAIRNILKTADWQIRFAGFTALLADQWSNGRAGVSERNIAADAADLWVDFEPLRDELVNGGPANQEAYDAAKKALHPNDKALYEELEGIYKSILDLRAKIDQAYRDGKKEGDVIGKWEIDKAKQEIQNDAIAIEKQIKAWVDKCAAESDKKVADALALAALQTLTNLDDDEDPDFDWDNLFDIDGDGNFILKDLLATTGIGHINTDKTFKDADGNDAYYEPVEYDEDGKPITNLHTFNNQLAAPGQEAEAEALARGLFKEEAKQGGELYEALKAFIAKVNEYKAARTLADHLGELKEELAKLSDQIINIDEHAIDNYTNYMDMLEIVEKWEQNIDDAWETVKLMPEGAAKEAAKQLLQNAENNDMLAFKVQIKNDYEEGHAWQDEVQEAWNKALTDLSTAVTGAIDKATGADPSELVAANTNSYEQFVKDYEKATEEYYDLVKKLDQLKNLDGDVVNKDELDGVAAKVNGILFSNANDNPKDKLDKYMKEGAAAYTDANTSKPAKAWSSQYSTDVNTVKAQIEGLIKDIDGAIDNSLALWSAKDATIYTEAAYAFNNYSIYWAKKKEIEAMPTKTAEQIKAKTAAYDAAVKAVIKANADFNDLQTKSDVLTKIKNDIQSSKTATKNYYTKELDVNAFFDKYAWMTDNFDDVLIAGEDAEATADYQTYKDFADAELAKDKNALTVLGVAFDEEVQPGDQKFQDVLDYYESLFEVPEGETFAVKKGAKSHDYIIAQIQAVTGTKTWNAEKKQVEWSEDGKCAFVHKLVENASPEALAAANADITAMETALAELEAYVNNFLVGPKYAEDIQDMKDAIAKVKEIANSDEAKKLAISIKDQVDKYKKQYGNMQTAKGDITKLANDAWTAEQTRLKNDINELRAESKLAAGAALGLDEQIDALWTKVNSAKLTDNYDKDGNFVDWTRDDLSGYQTEIKALYKQLRAANGTAIDADALVAELTRRLDAVKANTIEDAWVAGAPTVKKLQAEQDALVAAAEAAIAKAKADGDVDYLREKLTDMVMNAENKMPEVNADAEKVAKLQEQYNDGLELIDKMFATVVDRINGWSDGLAGNADVKAYLDAANTLKPQLKALAKEIYDNYEYVELGGAYSFVPSDEFMDVQMDCAENLQAAMNEAAKVDISNRLTALTKQLTMLRDKVAYNTYDEAELVAIVGPAILDADGNVVDYQNFVDAENAIKANYDELMSGYEKGLAFQAYDVDDYDEPTWKEIYLDNTVEEWKYMDVDPDPEVEDMQWVLTDGVRFDLQEMADALMQVVLGDMTGDGKVTLADARIIADIAMGTKEMPILGSDEFKSADVNEDSKIDLADAACAVNIYFYGNPNGPEEDEARIAETGNESVTVEAMTTAEGLTRLAISLNNAAEYTAFQMDLQLPAGMKLAAASLSDRASKQYLMTNQVDDMLRIGALSLKNKGITGNNGAVLYLDFEVAEGSDEFARFDNVFFVNKHGQKVEFNLGGITPTGIQSANAETALGQKFYDLGGRMKNSLKKGVNIVRDAAGNVKKVLTK